MPRISQFEKVLQDVETLSSEDQEALVDLIKRRQIERRREEIASNIAVSHQEYATGTIRRGTVEELMAESRD